MTVAFAEVDAAHRPAGRIVLLVLLLLLALAPGRGFAREKASCAPAATRLCLDGNRFQAEVSWTAPGVGSGAGQAVPLTADTGLFWFFSSSNLELTVKVLDGRTVNRHFWVFYGGLSTVEYTLTITDLQTGAQAIYRNPPGHIGSGADVSAFDEEAPPAASKLLRAASGATAAPFPVGPEFQVNVTAAGDQFAPAVAVAPDGSFLIVWLSSPLPPASFRADVFGRVYDPAGNPRGGEFRVNTTVSSSQERPRVAANATGQYLVVWNDDTIARARLLDFAGQPLSGEMTLASGNQTSPTPEVTADPAGGFLVVWRELSASRDSLRIHWRRFDAHGQPLGADASLEAAGFVPPPRVATSPLGGFLIVWGEGFSGTDFFAFSNVRAQRLDEMGKPVGAILEVNESEVGALADPLPVIYADGSFAVLWTLHQLIFDVGNLFARRFSATGAPTGPTVEFSAAEAVEGRLPAAVALPSGDTWALWYKDRLAQEPDGGVFAGVFDPSWNLKGPIARVNTATAGVQTEPAVATSPTGDIVAAWSSGDDRDRNHGLGGVNGTQDGNGFGVFAQRFTTASCALIPNQLCLGGRFSVGVVFTNPASGASGSGQPLPLTADTGAFWFFGPDNVELMIKVLDGRAVNGRFWVFYGALSDVEYTITVTDTETGQSKSYHNPPHHLESRADTQAF